MVQAESTARCSGREASVHAPLRVVVEEKETPKSGMRDVQWLSILLQPQRNSAGLDIDGLTRRNKCEGSSEATRGKTRGETRRKEGDDRGASVCGAVEERGGGGQ